MNLFYLLFLGNKIQWQKTKAMSPMLCSPGPRGRNCFQPRRLIVFYQQDATKAHNKPDWTGQNQDRGEVD